MKIILTQYQKMKYFRKKLIFIQCAYVVNLDLSIFKNMNFDVFGRELLNIILSGIILKYKN